jgi:glycosyltransferase involved in cell wall biosynthesis
MTEPLVSVKMITYNHAPFISKAIDGVLKQKVDFPIELVIGEDCSTDGTREIVFEYQKKYPAIIRVISSDKNVGMKQNGYRTARACRGKYIAFCEGDDYWHHPGKLQKQADYLEGHPECGLVYSSYDVYHVKSKKKIEDFVTYRKWKLPVNLSLSEIVEGKFGVAILTCTIMARRNLCQQIIEADPYLHQSKHFLMGDTQLWAEAANFAQLHYIPESLATHVITDESATRSRNIKKVLGFSVSNAELVLYLSNKYNLPADIRNKAKEGWFDSLLRLAFYERNVELADEIRRNKAKFTWKEWLRYRGAKDLAFYYVYRVGASFLNLFRKEHSQWL